MLSPCSTGELSVQVSIQGKVENCILGAQRSGEWFFSDGSTIDSYCLGYIHHTCCQCFKWWKDISWRGCFWQIQARARPDSTPFPPVSLVANRCAPVSSPLRIYPGSLDFWKALEEPRSHGFRLQISTVFGVNTQSSCHTGHNHKSLCLLVTDGESSLAGR